MAAALKVFQDHIVLVWVPVRMKRLDEDEWCKMFCESVPFTVHKMCSLPPMVFPSTTGLSVGVLRPMLFMPGCGGPHEFVNSVSFSFIGSLRCHRRSLLSCSLPTFVSSLPFHSLPSLLYILFFLFLPFFLFFLSLSPFFPPPSLSSLRHPPALVLASKVP